MKPRRHKRWVLVGVVAVTAVTLAAVVGCGGSKSRKIDVTAGEYYSEDEYASLSGGQKSNYCKQLTERMSQVQQAHQDLQKEIQDAKDLTQSIRRQIVPIEQQVLRLESRIRTLNDQIEAVKALPKEWLIKEGDTLTLIAMKPEIYNDIEKWTRIFEANGDKIDDPYYIFPDTVLVIPRDWPTD